MQRNDLEQKAGGLYQSSNLSQTKKIPSQGKPAASNYIKKLKCPHNGHSKSALRTPNNPDKTTQGPRCKRQGLLVVIVTYRQT